MLPALYEIVVLNVELQLAVVAYNETSVVERICPSGLGGM